MKTRLLNLICLLACIAAGTNMGIAQDVVTVLKNRFAHPQQFQSVSNIDFDKSQYQMVKSRNGNETYVKKDVLAACKKKFADAGDYVPVTLLFDMPQEVMDGIESIRIYNEDEDNMLFWWDIFDGMAEAYLCEGSTYQFLIQFTFYNRDSQISQGCRVGMIVMEDVVIDENATITISFADAKNVIYMEKKLPNGEAFADGDYDERIGGYINQPNVISTMGQLMLMDKDKGCIATYMLSHYECVNIDENGVSRDLRFKFLTSDMSERFTLVQTHVALGLDEDMNSYYTVQSIKTGVSESENLACSGDYKTVSSHVKPSIMGEHSESWIGPRAEIMFLNENTGFTCHNSCGYNTGVVNTQYNMYVCENGDVLPDYKTYYSATLDEYQDENSNKTAILLPWGDVSGVETEYQVITPEIIGGSYTPSGDMYLKPNSTFSFKESEITEPFGNSAPINVFGYSYTQMGSKIHQPKCNFIGRMGERRQTDNYSMNYSLSYNGEEVFNDYTQFNNWIWEWINGGHEDGAYDATIVNQNMTVDDMQGCNTTKVHYDTRNEDFTPPTAMMLQFRNAEDNSVTDRFEAGEDGMMYLAAKDYNFSMNENWQYCMECLPVNVKVSYAANGTDDWTEMVINEMPELFDEYSFGYIYATSFDQVMCNSANKWYDLKIELSDEAGNWQEQVVSPAFRIERGGSTSISEVETSSDAVVVARYSVDGRQIAAPQAGVNIVKMSDGTVRKVVVK